MKNGIGLLIVATVIFTAAFACSMGTANMSSFKTSKDKEGKQETSSFKAGETLYASAVVSNSSDKVTVKFTLVADDAPGLKKGDTAPGSEVKVELPGSGEAQYHLTIPADFKGGKFTINADMLNETGEKKDNKSASVTIAPGSSAPSSTTSDDKDDK